MGGRTWKYWASSGPVSYETEKTEKPTFGFEGKKTEPTEPTVIFAAACRSKSSTFAQAYLMLFFKDIFFFAVEQVLNIFNFSMP